MCVLCVCVVGVCFVCVCGWCVCVLCVCVVGVCFVCVCVCVCFPLRVLYGKTSTRATPECRCRLRRASTKTLCSPLTFLAGGDDDGESFDFQQLFIRYAGGHNKVLKHSSLSLLPSLFFAHPRNLSLVRCTVIQTSPCLCLTLEVRSQHL